MKRLKGDNKGSREKIKRHKSCEGNAKVKGKNKGFRKCKGATQNIEGENQKVRERKDDGEK